MKIKIDIETAEGIKDFEVEYQNMDNFIFNKAFAQYTRNLDLKALAKTLLNDMIVSPVEIKSINFWRKDFPALDSLCDFLIAEQGAFMKGQRKRVGIRKI